MSITISGAEAITEKQSTPEWYGPSTLSFFALDDVGCNGSESKLLDCLPQHNCIQNIGEENAGVQCLRKGMGDFYCFLINNKYSYKVLIVLGVKLEYGPSQESNNTLITVNGTQEDEKVLSCSTDRESNEFNIPGSWFLPNGSKISLATTNSQSLLDTVLGNQTVGLNIMNGAELPRGIYHSVR